MRRGDGGAGTSSALGMHGGSVIGASPGATGAAVVTVLGDGVFVYDVETQVRILAARRIVERDRTPSPPLSRPSLAPRLCSPPPPPPGRPRTHPPRVVRVSPARPASSSPSPRFPRPPPPKRPSGAPSELGGRPRPRVRRARGVRPHQRAVLRRPRSSRRSIRRSLARLVVRRRSIPVSRRRRRLRRRRAAPRRPRRPRPRAERPRRGPRRRRLGRRALVRRGCQEDRRVSSRDRIAGRRRRG